MPINVAIGEMLHGIYIFDYWINQNQILPAVPSVPSLSVSQAINARIPFTAPILSSWSPRPPYRFRPIVATDLSSSFQDEDRLQYLRKYRTLVAIIMQPRSPQSPL